MTDNGATAGADFYNAGMRGRKIGLWDGGHRVPCFMRWPKGGLGGGRDIGELTEVQDILPTLIDLCGITIPSKTRFDGISLERLVRGNVQRLPDRMLVIQFSRMNAGRPQWGDSAVLWRKWRLVSNHHLSNVAEDPAQEHNVSGQHPEIAARMRAHYEQWWKDVEPRLDSFLPVHVGADEENPTLLSPTEWADSFLDQGNQIRRGERRNGMWHVMVERGGKYRFNLRRWPKDADAPMCAGLAPHDGEDGDYPAGVALPIARARLTIGGQDLSKMVSQTDREASFITAVGEGRTTMQTWFYDEKGQEISGAYFVYVERIAG
jgi:hypothetical protein